MTRDIALTAEEAEWESPWVIRPAADATPLYDAIAPCGTCGGGWVVDAEDDAIFFCTDCCIMLLGPDQEIVGYAFPESGVLPVYDPGTETPRVALQIGWLHP